MCYIQCSFAENNSFNISIYKSNCRCVKRSKEVNELKSSSRAPLTDVACSLIHYVTIKARELTL